MTPEEVLQNALVIMDRGLSLQDAKYVIASMGSAGYEIRPKDMIDQDSGRRPESLPTRDRFLWCPECLFIGVLPADGTAMRVLSEQDHRRCNELIDFGEPAAIIAALIAKLQAGPVA